MKPRPAEHKTEVLLNLPRLSADIGEDDDIRNEDDNSYGHFATNKYKLKYCDQIL
jgi:hypothetical protein